ncbi:RecQ family ATP-dependent DNA helicase [uncultured Piscinibacter sp.]|uniref:RecQ family ATP-dependent DNA helicase n=1 Tax=uncultured Piscinibacter sp. TaxID=1131835 RepID=UPI00260C0009|nr:RecQ family ATP-dependent DNA helicase [uncultured Piscinibacter sp.]
MTVGLIDKPSISARQLLAEWAALSVDIESNPSDADRIFKVGAVRSDNDTFLGLSTGRLGTEEVVHRVNAVAKGARVLVGHNLRRHDLPQLRRQYPGLSFLDLPIIDTLELSAIAFPTNPYHRLVKGYKLLSDSRNDPLKDARLTLDLLGDEVDALAEMHRSDPEWMSLLHFLLRDDELLDGLIAAIRRAPAPEAAAATNIAIGRFGEMCCSTRLARFGADDSNASAEHRTALAYALGWVRVSGGNSVLPIWVHSAIPRVRSLIGELREHTCGQAGCRYCTQQHDPESLLFAHFQKPTFRSKPQAPDGGSLQRAIVVAGLERKSLLAVLPTGGGKSICYQLPALVHYWRSGQLTVIVSPLQSLMKDQVDNLVAAGVNCAVTINGLLTPLERRAALDKIRLGDAGIVLVSPEQFRSRTFTEAIRMREIATWVFDEAHCLSKWGHDFRTDYLYVSRFIREHFSNQLAPIACFTATAKPDVIDDLCAHFRDGLNIELGRFLGGHERENLSYLVVPAPRAQKAQRIVEILRHELKGGGAAVIFCATRKTAETMAEMVTSAGINCGCFHGGLGPDTKKEIQQRFIQGDLPVIAATNAFGMGVDKPDIRVVIHADIPGSLENYLQEAGRAGRDGDAARCVLLFDEEDVETQFRLSSTSQLTHRDFVGLLKAVRERVKRLKSPEIVVSAKELLAESEGTAIDIESRDASTKVTTAIAWLERSGFLKRNENNSRVFPASLRVSSLEEAQQRIFGADLPETTRQRFMAVAATLFRNQSPEGVSTDELMLEAGVPPEECFRILHQLEQLGILANDLGLTVRVSKGVKGASDLALEHLDRMERALLDLMSENAPDADADGNAQHLSVRPLCTELRRRLGLSDSDPRVSPQVLRNCLRSLSESFGSGTEKRSMLQVRGLGPDSLRVTLHRPWSQIRTICERRRVVAQVVLARLLAELPAGARESGLIVECKARDLLDAIDSDLELKSNLRDPATALEHALLYLHENRVVELDKGRSVFRSAMTILTDPEALKRRFAKDDFAPLQEFYRERTLQTHVMHEYARLGSQSPDKALELVAAYFTWPRKRFVREFFKGRTDLLELATTDESFRRIVDDLHHPVQQALVEKPEHGNHLVLAGPGSGKTRVIVHRIAYLLRVRRVAPDRIIALAFNRSAAVELRRRLVALVGDDARGVAVLTYHAMALRLTGTSLATADRRGASVDFGRLLQDAIDLLEGRSDAFSDADELRDRLLQGYEYIFVDEYQDIDEQQYALVSALAGRRQADPDAKLSIMAVGDDDQNIYSFKGASVEFIRRFQTDYGGEVTYLVENFRSTQNIIAAANHVIQRANDRMKVDHPIRINTARASDPPGGRYSVLDQEHAGKVRLIAAPADSNRQAQVVFGEIQRLRRADSALALGDIAILARTHRSLEPLRALCDIEGLRYEVLTRESARAQLSLMQSREGWRLAGLLRARGSGLVSTAALRRWLRYQRRRQLENPYWEDLSEAIEEFAGATGAARVPAAEVMDALYEAATESRRGGHASALKLMTAHGAKGLEFGHVIVMDCADWHWSGEDERRLLYVAMTRAKETLTVMRAEGGRNPYLVDLGTVDGVIDLLPAVRPDQRRDIDRRYASLGPADVDIGFAGRLATDDPAHARIASLSCGSEVRVADKRISTTDGVLVGKLANKTVPPPSPTRGVVTGILVRTREQSPPEYQAALKADRWETVLVEMVVEPGE